MSMELAITNFTNASNALVNCSAVETFKTSGDYESEDYDLKVCTIVIMTLLIIIGIFGFIGNLMVIVGVAANPEMRSNTNILMINLAVADMLFIIVCTPFGVVRLMIYWEFDYIWCKTLEYLINIAIFVNIYTLLLMSLDRYLAVVHPIASIFWRKENDIIPMIGLVWAMSLVLSAPMLVMSKDLWGYCDIWNMYNLRKMIVFQVFFFLINYMLPLMLMCIFYMSILITLKRGTSISTRRRRDRKSITRLVFVIVSVFAICWGPVQVILLMFIFDMYAITEATLIIWLISYFLAYTNSCVNPILYAFLNEDFRNAFQKIIYCKQQAKLNN